MNNKINKLNGEILKLEQKLEDMYFNGLAGTYEWARINQRVDELYEELEELESY